MKAKIHEGEVHIRWQYDNVVNDLGKTVQRTRCFAEKDRKTVAVVSITKFHKDRENKEYARKVSLGKLIKEILPNKKEDNDARMLIWQSYHERFKKTPATSALTIA